MSAFSDYGCITELEVSPSHTCGIVSITSECARVRPALGREGLLPARVRKPLSFVLGRLWMKLLTAMVVGEVAVYGELIHEGRSWIEALAGTKDAMRGSMSSPKP